MEPFEFEENEVTQPSDEALNDFDMSETQGSEPDYGVLFIETDHGGPGII